MRRAPAQRGDTDDAANCMRLDSDEGRTGEAEIGLLDGRRLIICRAKPEQMRRPIERAVNGRCVPVAALHDLHAVADIFGQFRSITGDDAHARVLR